MPDSLIELREAWPVTKRACEGSSTAPVISLQVALQAALSELLEADDRPDEAPPKRAACTVAGIEPSPHLPPCTLIPSLSLAFTPSLGLTYLALAFHPHARRVSSLQMSFDLTYTTG